MKTTLILLIDRLLHLTEGDLKRSCMSLRLISFLILLGAMPALTMAEPNRHRDGECGHENYSDNYYVPVCTGGSTSFPNEGPENLFDSNSNTKWCYYFNTETFVTFNFGGPVYITSYTLRTAGDIADYQNRNWKSWVLYGKNDADSDIWNTVHTVTDAQLPVTNLTFSSPFNVNTQNAAYQYYKLVLTAVVGGNQNENIHQMADINLNVACSEGHEHGTEANPHVDDDNDGFCDLCGIILISPAPQVDGVYQISNAGNLYWFAALVNGDKTIIGEDVSQNSSANAKLMNDIVVNENVLVDGALNTDAATVNKFLTWTPIGSSTNKYSGTFDGDNHTISGLYFDNGGANTVGLFGYIAKGSVKNLGVIDSYFNAGDFVGTIVGYILDDNDVTGNEGAISNCYNKGVCKGNNYAGGIVGSIASTMTKITNCYNTGTITGSYSGGIVGPVVRAEITNCYNTGTVIGHLSGGILSSTDNISAISNCYYLKEQDGINSGINGIGDTGSGDEQGKTVSKTNTQFASGEVAYLLQGSQDVQVWGQNIDNEEGLQNKQDYPVLSDARVYKIVESEGIRYSNFMGGSVVWSYEDGVLTIHGEGSMIDFDEEETKPWKQYLSDINTVIVKEEITGIGNYAFSDVKDDAKIFFYTTTAPTLGANVFPDVNNNTYSIFVPITYLSSNQENTTNWSSYSSKIEGMPTYTSDGWQMPTKSKSTEPTSTDHVVIDDELVLGQQSTLSKTTDNNNVLTVSSFGHTENGRLTIQDGGQLTCQQAHGEVTVEKNITGNASTPNWYTISSPLKGNVAATSTSITGLIDETTPATYALYRYDELNFTWENYKLSTNNFTTLDAGRGYLYANKNGVKLSFEGEINTESVEYTLTASDNTLSGFHLIGNPFTHNITFDNLSGTDGAKLVDGYYIIDGNGGWGAQLGNETDVIEPGQGLLIKTTAEGTLTISPTEPAAKGQEPRAKSQEPMLALNVTNGNYSDRAFVIFSEGEGLDKINHENKDIPMLYIPMSDADYAIAMMDESVNEIPVSFETNKMGEFTISLRQENCEFEELYLLDKETGAKVNILEQDYTFMATSGDNPDRFILVKSQGSQPEAQSNFAYINNGDVVIYGIEGNAHIDIYDVLGRRVYNTNGSDDVHILTTDGYSAGVYIVRLMDEKGLRTQKVIID